MGTDLLSIVSSVAQRMHPPLTTVFASETGSFDDATVELRDGHVAWRVIRERSVLVLVASPEFDRTAWYDADLLKRFLHDSDHRYRRVDDRKTESASDLMTRSVEQVVNELLELRQP